LKLLFEFEYDKVEPFPGSVTIFISTSGSTGGYSYSSPSDLFFLKTLQGFNLKLWVKTHGKQDE